MRTPALKRFFSTAIYWLRTLCYPHECIFCHAPSEGHVCAKCLHSIPLRRNVCCKICGLESSVEDGPEFICDECMQHRPAFDQVVPAARYTGVLRDLIHYFKYNKWVWLQQDLALLLESAYIEHFVRRGITFDYIIPVPMTRQKRRRRGYNQANLLSNALAQTFHLRQNTTLLKHVQTPIISQTSLHHAGRFANAKNAFVLGKSMDLTGKTILLIDDVITTGATLDACAKLLKGCGAKGVYGLTLARGLI